LETKFINMRMGVSHGMDNLRASYHKPTAIKVKTPD